MGDILSRELGLPLDIIVPRKIGHPMHEEYALGALTETGDVRLDPEAVAMSGLRSDDPRIKAVIEREKKEAQRRLKFYRGDRPPVNLTDKKVILVDDGVATGSTMKAAIESARARGAKEIIVAVPVGAPDSMEELRKLADRVVVLLVPPHFRAVGLWYQTFDQTEDDEVIKIMQQHAKDGTGSKPASSEESKKGKGGGSSLFSSSSSSSAPKASMQSQPSSEQAQSQSHPQSQSSSSSSSSSGSASASASASSTASGSDTGRSSSGAVQASMPPELASAFPGSGSHQSQQSQSQSPGSPSSSSSGHWWMKLQMPSIAMPWKPSQQQSQQQQQQGAGAGKSEDSQHSQQQSEQQGQRQGSSSR